MALKNKFAWSVFVLQLFFIAIFCVFTKYGSDLDAADPVPNKTIEHQGQEDNSLKNYPLFQDMNALIFIGVAYLYSFLKKYGYSGVGMNFLLCAIGVEWGIIADSWWDMKEGKIEISVASLIKGEYAAVSGVIALGAIFGKAGVLQMVVFVIIEILMYTILNHCRQEYLQVSDAGESIALHMFAAVFGCSTAYVMDRGVSVKGNPNEGNSYNSNLFCIFGTILIWVFWPSFNAAACDDLNSQHRCIINTFFALVGSAVTSFMMSSLVHKGNKFTMMHIQNGSLAGAVGVGALANLMIHPFGALAIGAFTGCLSVAGFKFFTPFLARLNIYDPCGISSLHGLPGLLSGILAIPITFLASKETYGFRLYKFYPAMAPLLNTTELNEIQTNSPIVIEPGLGRTVEFQALYQFIYILAIFVASCLSGVLTGSILRLKCFKTLENKHMYLDEAMWDISDIEDYHQSKYDSNRSTSVLVSKF